MAKAIKYIIGSAIGAILGFAYYFFVGCASGVCAITSNPYISTLYGAIFGLLITIVIFDKKGTSG
jgi:phage shock protein E